jgi:hypothetical protein
MRKQTAVGDPKHTRRGFVWLAEGQSGSLVCLIATRLPRLLPRVVPIAHAGRAGHPLRG